MHVRIPFLITAHAISHFHVKILAAARLRILANPFSTASSTKELLPLYAGQPISATLTIETSFHWAPLEDMTKESYLMRFDVEEMTKDWLVSGRKRGDFVAKVCNLSPPSRTLIYTGDVGPANLRSTDHTDCSPSWRAQAPQSGGASFAIVWARQDEVCGGPELRNLSTTWSGDGTGTTTGRTDYFCR